jgi:outer membrane PBP1 activator LpoA protein
VRPILLILMLGLAGCATYADRGPRVRVAVEEGDYETAATVAQNFAADEPKDALVWNLDAAAALRAQGKLKESAKVLEQVETSFRAE